MKEQLARIRDAYDLTVEENKKGTDPPAKCPVNSENPWNSDQSHCDNGLTNSPYHVSVTQVFSVSISWVLFCLCVYQFARCIAIEVDESVLIFEVLPDSRLPRASGAADEDHLHCVVTPKSNLLSGYFFSAI